MPSGIKFASDIFRHKMHELIDGLNGVEVIADDSVVVGYGDTLQLGSLQESRRKPFSVPSEM